MINQTDNRLDTIAKAADHFRVFAEMGVPFAEAKAACPYRFRMSTADLIAGLAKHGVRFPDTAKTKAKRYPARTRHQTIIEAIRESGVNVTPQAVRYRVNKMGWPLERAISEPMMSRREAGRLGVQRRDGKRGVYLEPNGQTIFKFLRG